MVFNATDWAWHTFWRFYDKSYPEYDPQLAEKYSSVIEEVYERIDNKLGIF
jgi:predicted AlkP superfamily phosphohydrolase/phosphomutase